MGALLERRVDLEVHSLKDLPTFKVEGLDASPRCRSAGPTGDAFVSKKYRMFAELPTGGARVATSSLRRKAAVAASPTHLTLIDIRGNVETRLH